MYAIDVLAYNIYNNYSHNSWNVYHIHFRFHLNCDPLLVVKFFLFQGFEGLSISGLSRILDNIAFTLGNQFKPNQTRLMTSHQNFNSLFSINDPR